MVTVPAALIPLALRAIRANATFVSEEGARAKVRERTLRPQPYGPPRRLRSTVRVEVAREGGWPVYTLEASTRRSAGSVVYVHGGGWVNEIASQHWSLAQQIAEETGMRVILPIYPLVPFGTASDAAKGVAGLVRAALESGPVALAGDSAGGQIAL